MKTRLYLGRRKERWRTRRKKRVRKKEGEEKEREEMEIKHVKELRRERKEEYIIKEYTKRIRRVLKKWLEYWLSIFWT